jgi:F0F1-type ATP synthase delta subunit
MIRDGIDFVGYRTWFNSRIIWKRSLFKIKRVLKKYPDINRIASYLSHSKRTNSLLYVVKQIMKVAENFIEFIKRWLMKNNKKEVYYEVFQS